jgi:hypothetical protein
VRWLIGDWLLVGEALYGERHAQWVEATGYDAGALANFRWVASRIPPSRRREEPCSWGHHEAVAGLEAEEQEALLGRAVASRWTRAQLREAVHALREQGVVAESPHARAARERKAARGEAEPVRPALRAAVRAVVAQWRADDEPGGVEALIEALLRAIDGVLGRE